MRGCLSYFLLNKDILVIFRLIFAFNFPEGGKDGQDLIDAYYGFLA